MRPKARGLAQHVSPSGWLEESDPPGRCDFVRDGRPLPPAISVTYWSLWQELPSCELMEFSAAVHNHPSWATSHKEDKVWYSSRPMPSLCKWPIQYVCKRHTSTLLLFPTARKHISFVTDCIGLHRWNLCVRLSRPQVMLAFPTVLAPFSDWYRLCWCSGNFICQTVSM
jgi:hypothetical protein